MAVALHPKVVEISTRYLPCMDLIHSYTWLNTINIYAMQHFPEEKPGTAHPPLTATRSIKNAIQTLNEELQAFPGRLSLVNFVLSNKPKKSAKKSAAMAEDGRC